MRRYPQIHVSVRSANPLAVISAVRGELRRAGAEPEEIDRFSREAFAASDPVGLRDVVRAWARVESPIWGD